MDGWVNLNKPCGPTSHQATAWVKGILGVSRAGHAGTLDPHAVGVLPVAVGRARKLLIAMAKADKEYVCIARFKKPVAFDEVKNVMKEFRGRIYQTPPKESAVKKVLRTRVIHDIKLLEVKDRLALFKVKCQHGTYIRVLCADIGEIMGNACEMLELRRTMAGPFRESDGITLQELKDTRKLLPLEASLAHLARVVVGNNAVSAVCHGAKLAAPGVKDWPEVKKGGLAAMFSEKDELIGIGVVLRANLGKSGFVVQPKSIVMGKDLYPRKWKK